MEATSVRADGIPVSLGPDVSDESLSRLGLMRIPSAVDEDPPELDEVVFDGPFG
jgi:hypothetical protein